MTTIRERCINMSGSSIQQLQNLKPNDLEPLAPRNNSDRSKCSGDSETEDRRMVYMCKLPTDANLQRKSVLSRE